MRITNSKDGQPRATIRVTHRIGLRELVIACILDLPHEQELTKNDIHVAVHECLQRGGSELFDHWADGIDDTDRMRLEEWATACVVRHWPHLLPHGKSPANGLTQHLQ